MKNVEEKGFALVLSLVLLLVMSLMGGSLIVIASGDHKNNNTSDQYQQTFYVAETGLMQGEKWVTDNYLGHWLKGGTDEDPYSGTVPNYCQTMQAKDAAFECLEKGAEGYAEYSGEESAYNTHVEGYSHVYVASGGTSTSLVRHTWNKGPAYNEYKIEDASKTQCMNSFKNIEANKELYVASGSAPKTGLFWDIIGPIVTEKYFLEKSDSGLGFTNVNEKKHLDITEIIRKEVAYLKRYAYEFFIINIGGAAYGGSGSSIAQTSGGVAPLQGTAYKIYACGKFFDQGGNLSIIVPLESVVVMPY